MLYAIGRLSLLLNMIDQSALSKLQHTADIVCGPPLCITPHPSSSSQAHYQPVVEGGDKKGDASKEDGSGEEAEGAEGNTGASPAKTKRRAE